MYVVMDRWMYNNVDVCVYVYVGSYYFVCVYVYICVCVYVCMYVCMGVCIYSCMHTYVRMYLMVVKKVVVAE